MVGVRGWDWHLPILMASRLEEFVWEGYPVYVQPIAQKFQSLANEIDALMEVKGNKDKSLSMLLHARNHIARMLMGEFGRNPRLKE